MTSLLQRIPLVRRLADHDRAAVRDDVVAGVTTAVMLVPQAMAYALLAGLDPIVGLYAALLPLVVYALMGSSPVLAVGPVAMDSLLVASGVGALAAGGTEAYLALATLLALMVGVMQLAMGWGRLGFLVNLLSRPVIAGFTSAAAVVIATSQLPHALGVDLPRRSDLGGAWWAIAGAIPEAHLPTLWLTGAAVAALVLLKRYAPKVPRFLVVVAASIVAVWVLDLDAAGVAIVGEVPAGLPQLGVPAVAWDDVVALFPTALAITLVAIMEAISVGTAYASQRGETLDPDREFVSLGLANVAAAVSGAYPVTGGLSRTAVNAAAGARSPLAGLVTAGGVGVTLLFLTPVFERLPKATLAAIIITAVLGLVDVRGARELWRLNRPDFALMAVTFAATLGLGIEQGIGVGVLASMGWFVREASTPHVAALGRLEGTTTYRKLSRHEAAQAVPGVTILRIDAPLFFANARFLADAIARHTDDQTRAVILDATGIGHVDATGALALEAVAADHTARGIPFLLAGVHEPVQEVLDRTTIDRHLAASDVTVDVHGAVLRVADDAARRVAHA